MVPLILASIKFMPFYFAANCKGHNFFGLTPWYQYLDLDANCNVVSFKFPDDILPVGLAILEILLRVAGLVAVIMIIVGGFEYVRSGGESNKVEKAKNTILFAVIGLVVVIVARALVALVINAL